MNIVLVKFTEGATSAQKEDWKRRISFLPSAIPEIKSLVCGKKIAHARDQGWDDGVILTFDNIYDMHTYSDATAHKEYQQATAEQTADKLIFDIEA
ncbi:hypothetical protein BD410DRAFT_729329 [Rickenella mellea]|uniref:Stress-response A/B barrel domain-containing protein n=1 Tax=Rickenella mellea TaxID=50990 RepID=A0A4Y7PTJ3_9AGAM|nr:hypothetical protein BD410DRAFT_729329 [Rickenella mellea]